MTVGLTVVGGQVRLPELSVEAPEILSATAERVRQFDRARLSGVMNLTGLVDPGRSIRVVLVPEGSRVARDAPPWVAAFADPPRDRVVLFPARIGSYPYDSLEVVLHHEVAHILTARAASGGRVPRWFNEGIASAAERSWGLADRSRFVWEAMVGGRVSITELEGLFGEGHREAARAYVLAQAMVRDLLQTYGPGAVRRILARMSAGATFDQAFITATGTTVSGATRAFWRRTNSWEQWVTFAASPFTLWSLMTGLSLVAIWRHRRRRAEKRRRWEAEERAEAEAWEEHRRKYRIQ